MVEPSTTPVSAAHPRQAITGLVPPQTREALIREAWPTVSGINAGLAALAKKLMQTYLLAPVGFLLLLPLFLLKFAPFLCRRYTLTNRRIMIQRGLKPTPTHQVALVDIDEVRFDPNEVDAFYVSGTLTIVSKGQVVLTLPGVPEPEGFRQTIVSARNAWTPYPRV